MTQQPLQSHGAQSKGPDLPPNTHQQQRVPGKTNRGSTGWWVAAGVGVVLIVALVWMLLQGNRQTVLTPTPFVSKSTVTDPDDLGEFTPTYELRELSSLTFPETFEGYAVVSDYTGSIRRSASYKEGEGPGLFTAKVTYLPSDFAFGVKYFADPVLIGDAVCGAMTEDGVNKECVMAGIDGPLAVSTAGESMTLEELARIVQAFYKLP